MLLNRWNSGSYLEIPQFLLWIPYTSHVLEEPDGYESIFWSRLTEILELFVDLKLHLTYLICQKSLINLKVPSKHGSSMYAAYFICGIFNENKIIALGISAKTGQTKWTPEMHQSCPNYYNCVSLYGTRPKTSRSRKCGFLRESQMKLIHSFVLQFLCCIHYHFLG